MHGLRSSLLNGGKAAAASRRLRPRRNAAARACATRAGRRLQELRDDRPVAAERKNIRHREIVERATIVFEGRDWLARVVNISASGLTIESGD